LRLLLLLPFVAVLPLAAPAFAAEITCDGPFAPDSSEQLLIDTFGKANVVTGDVPGPEGTTVLATTVFPNDPARKFEVGWWDEDHRSGLAYATIPAGDTAPGGVRIGMGLGEVQQLNGEPFGLYGFGWDYGGAASIETGKLADLPGGCHLGVTFQPTVELPAGVDPTPITGDIQINSDLPLLQQVQPKVTDLSISYPDFGATED
jgi:hypothetical protein